MARKEMTRPQAVALISERLGEMELSDLVEVTQAKATLLKRVEMQEAERDLDTLRRKADNLRRGIEERWPAYLAKGGEVDDEVIQLLQGAGLEHLLNNPSVPRRTAPAAPPAALVATSSVAPATGSRAIAGVAIAATVDLNAAPEDGERDSSSDAALVAVNNPAIAGATADEEMTGPTSMEITDGGSPAGPAIVTDVPPTNSGTGSAPTSDDEDIPPFLRSFLRWREPASAPQAGDGDGNAASAPEDGKAPLPEGDANWALPPWLTGAAADGDSASDRAPGNGEQGSADDKASVDAAATIASTAGEDKQDALALVTAAGETASTTVSDEGKQDGVAASSAIPVNEAAATIALADLPAPLPLAQPNSATTLPAPAQTHELPAPPPATTPSAPASPREETPASEAAPAITNLPTQRPATNPTDSLAQLMAQASQILEDD